MQNCKRHKSVGMSLPTDLLKRIDNERRDVSRSRFILRLLGMTEWNSEPYRHQNNRRKQEQGGNQLA